MVKLPCDQTRAGERRARSSSRSHHNWGTRISRRDCLHTEPRGLQELEKLARTTVNLMERHSPKSEHNFDKAMDLLRLQYNLNFMILCEICSGPHINDELIAPER